MLTKGVVNSFRKSFRSRPQFWIFAVLLVITPVLIIESGVVPATTAQQNEAIPAIGPFGAPNATGATDNNDDLTSIEQFGTTDNGTTTEPTTVRFINTLRNNGNAAGFFIIGAPVVPAGFSVRVSVDSGATFSNLDGGATLTTPTPVDPGEERNIDIRITAPAGSSVDVPYDTVIQVASNTVATLNNRTIDRIVIKRIEPKLTLVKSVTDLNGGQTIPGDILEYTLTLTNPEPQPVGRTFVAEFIPPETDFVPGSIEITAGANAGKKTDAQDDDQADYYPGTNGGGQINIGTGTGAGGRDAQGRLKGGTLGPGESNTFRFQVRVRSGIPQGTVIVNGADWGGEDIYPGGKSNLVSTTVSGAVPFIGPFADPEASGPTDQNDDLSLFRVNFDISNGLTTRAGQVRFINTVRNTGDVPGKFVISASMIPAGFSVQISVDSGATFSSLDNGGSLITPTEVNPQESRNIDVRVILPSGLAVNTNYDVVMKAAWEADPVQSNLTIDRVIPDPNPPNLALVKTVRDQNGNDIDGKTVQRGETIEYSLTLTNGTSDPIARTFIAEYLPPEVDYIAGSVRISAGANAGNKTDTRGDDQVDYFPAVPAAPNGQINIFTGTDAAADKGGILAPGESTTVAFSVKVKADAAIGAQINNGADWGAENFFAGGKSNIVTVTVAQTPCPAITISPAAGALPAGQVGSAYSVNFVQAGGTSPVKFALDAGSLPGGVILNSATGALTGTPASAGAFGFTLRVTDANGCFATASYTLIIDAAPGEGCNPIICFRSANYYSLWFGTNEIPNGTVLIAGVNSNVRVSSTDARVKLALDGKLGELNRQYVAAQLNILNAGGLAAANVITALKSALGCYGLKFSPVSLSVGELSTGSKLEKLLQMVEGNSLVTGQAQASDACILARILRDLNGDSLSSLCHKVKGESDFSGCTITKGK